MLGFHFALNLDEAKRLFANRDEPTMRELLHALSEEKQRVDGRRNVSYSPNWKQLDRCLGVELPDSAVDNELVQMVFLGGRRLLDTSSLVVAMVRPDLVSRVADQLTAIDDHELERRFDLAPPTDNTANDAEQSRVVLHAAQAFFSQAAADGDAVIFVCMDSV